MKRTIPVLPSAHSLALAIIFLAVWSLVMAPTAAWAAEMATNGNFSGSTSWAIGGTGGSYDATQDNTGDGSGSMKTAAVGRNAQESSTYTQAVTIGTGAEVTAASLSGMHTSLNVAAATPGTITIDLEYTDLTTVQVFSGTLTEAQAWGNPANGATLPVTLTLDAQNIIVTVTTKGGNNASAESTAWVDDVSITYTPAAAASAPTLSTPTHSAVTATGATLGATIDSDGGAAITERGTVWGIAPAPIGNVLAEGGTATGAFSHARTGLPAGSLVYYRGYATNSQGTAYSADGSFFTEPGTQASGVGFTGVADTTMTVNWTRGDGDSVIVLMKSGTAVDSAPVDDNGYLDDPAFGSGSQIGSGNYVIYNGTGTSVSVTGLSASTTYHVAVYEQTALNYKNSTAAAIGNQTTAAGASVPTLSTPTHSAVTATGATLGATITSDGGAAITERGTVWGIAPAPIGNVLAEGGTATGAFSHARTGLPAGSLIYYRGYATNAQGTAYSADDFFFTEPGTQASGVGFTGVAATTMTVNWTRGDGEGVIVLMKSGTAVDSDPVDDSGYLADPAFGSGSQIGSGNYVIYNGTGTSVSVTGLTGSTTYHIAVYEQTALNYKNSTAAAIGNQTTGAGASVPTLSTPAHSAVTVTGATLGATITSDGGAAITERGTVWGEISAPTGNALAEGGTATGAFSHARTGLTAGTLIYYRGYATNAQGTAYSADGAFYTEPGTQASGVGFANVASSTMDVTWTRGFGDGVIVLMKSGAAVDSDPVDDSGYLDDPAFGSGSQIGSGNYVIYNGTGTSVSVTGLSASTTYHVAVYEYSGFGPMVNYKNSTAAATGSQATAAGASAPTLSTPTHSAVTATGATLGATIDSDGGAAITERGTVWGATPAPTGNALAEGGTATGAFSHARTGLPAGSPVYYRGYATNAQGTAYSADEFFFTEPGIQASGIGFTGVADTTMTVNWTRGNGEGVIVLMKSGAAVDSDPVDDSDYLSDPAFGSGSQIGSGNYVIYNGSGTSVSVTGLSASTTYHVAVYEQTALNYKNSTAAATGSQATGASPVDTLSTSNPAAVESADPVQGATGIVMQRVQVDSDAAADGAILLSSVTVADIGTAATSDIDNVRVYADTDTTFTGSTLIGSAAFSTDPVTVTLDQGTVGDRTVTNPTAKHLFVVYDISASATAGNTVRSRITDITVGAPDNGAAGLTYDSNSLTVQGSATAPVITGPASLSDGTEGTAYLVVFTATGTTPITWSVTAGALPDGMVLEADGTYTGTPTAAATYNFTVTATNVAGSDNSAYSHTIQAVAIPSAPTGLTLSNMRAAGPFVIWDAVAGATSYNVYRSPDDSTWEIVGSVSAPTTTLHDTLAPDGNTPYWWIVNAVNGSGESVAPTSVAGRTALWYGWNMVSAPYNTTGQKPTDVYGSWASFSYYWSSSGATDPDNSGAWTANPDMTPAYGQFVWAANDSTVLSASGSANAAEVVITLLPGWNIISNPSLTGMTDIANLWLWDAGTLAAGISASEAGNTLYYWNGSTYDSWNITLDDPTVEPWKSYFILNLDSVNHTLTIRH